MQTHLRHLSKTIIGAIKLYPATYNRLLKTNRSTALKNYNDRLYH